MGFKKNGWPLIHFPRKIAIFIVCHDSFIFLNKIKLPLANFIQFFRLYALQNDTISPTMKDLIHYLEKMWKWNTLM